MSPTDMKKAGSQQFADLHEQLSNEWFLKAFKEFCLKEYNIENLLFWLDVEIFRSTEASKHKDLAQRIYDTYISRQGPLQINVSQKQIDNIAWPQENPEIHIFDDLQVHVFNMMKDDSLPRFQQSSFYQEFLAKKEKDPKKFEAAKISNFAKFFEKASDHK